MRTTQEAYATNQNDMCNLQKLDFQLDYYPIKISHVCVNPYFDEKMGRWDADDRARDRLKIRRVGEDNQKGTGLWSRPVAKSCFQAHDSADKRAVGFITNNHVRIGGR